MPTILLVDDEVDLREAIAFDFSRKKFNVLMASGGNEAFAIFNKETVDVVLSDVRMADGDGLGLLDRIKSVKPSLPVAMLLTGLSEAATEDTYERGADAIFSKPFDRKTMLEIIMRALLTNQQRWQPTAPFNAKLARGEVKFNQSQVTLQAQVSRVGRGGFFVGLDTHLPNHNEPVSFHVELQNPKGLVLAGEGLVRWIRKTPRDNMRIGCGIEITALEPSCIEHFCAHLEKNPTVAFLPKS